MKKIENFSQNFGFILDLKIFEEYLYISMKDKEGKDFSKIKILKKDVIEDLSQEIYIEGLYCYTTNSRFIIDVEYIYLNLNENKNYIIFENDIEIKDLNLSKYKFIYDILNSVAFVNCISSGELEDLGIDIELSDLKTIVFPNKNISIVELDFFNPLDINLWLYEKIKKTNSFNEVVNLFKNTNNLDIKNKNFSKNNANFLNDQKKEKARDKGFYVTRTPDNKKNGLTLFFNEKSLKTEAEYFYVEDRLCLLTSTGIPEDNLTFIAQKKCMKLSKGLQINDINTPRFKNINGDGFISIKELYEILISKLETPLERIKSLNNKTKGLSINNRWCKSKFCACLGCDNKTLGWTEQEYYDYLLYKRAVSLGIF